MEKKWHMQLKHRLNQGLLALMVLSVVIIATQCVEEYNPDIAGKDNLLVVNGSIIRGDEQQTILVSRSTSVKNPAFIAVGGCNVVVTDDRDNIFQFEEEITGSYSVKIDLEYLEILNVFDNDLSGKIPSQLANSINLKQLLVAENNFADTKEFSKSLLSNGAKLDLTNPYVVTENKGVIAIETEDEN